jgi:Protein of unknown function (DUF3485)
MNRQSKVAFAVALALIASTGVGLSRLQALQRLGRPGVKLVERLVYREDGETIGTNSVALPEQVLNFESREQPIAKVVWNWLPKDTTYAQRLYRAPDGFRTMANVVLMGTDRTSIHDPKYCLAGQGFQTLREEFDSVPIQEPHPYSLPVYKWTVRHEVVTPEGAKVPQSALYVFWFVADDQLTANHKERMWWMARDLVTRGVLQRWAYVSCFSVCAPGQEEATYARMREWIAAAVPQFQRATGPALVGTP